MKSPSQWGDDKRATPGHDEMQFRLYQNRKAVLYQGIRNGEMPALAPYTSIAPGAFSSVDVTIERPFVNQGHILGYADVCEVWQGSSGIAYVIYEVKPKIHSIGAVLRQCKAMEQLVAQPACLLVIPVVPWNDPKVDMLIAVFRSDDGVVWVEQPDYSYRINPPPGDGLCVGED